MSSIVLNVFSEGSAGCEGEGCVELNGDFLFCVEIEIGVFLNCKNCGVLSDKGHPVTGASLINHPADCLLSSPPAGTVTSQLYQDVRLTQAPDQPSSCSDFRYFFFDMKSSTGI